MLGSSVEPRIHKAKQYRAAIAGITPMLFVSNHHFPRHTHDQFGIGLLSSGGHKSWSRLGTVRATAGDIIMVNPGEMHDGAPLDGSLREWRILYLEPAVVACEANEDFLGEAEIVRPVASDPVLAQRLTALYANLAEDNSDPLEREQDLLRAVICLFRRHGVAPFVPMNASPSIRRALARIDTAPEEPVSLKELAALSGVSRFHFLRSFSRETGITPHAYVVQRRVRLAQRLLAQGHTPADAAVQAGFSDQSHLTRAFVRQVGVTPGRYRTAISSKTS